MGLLFKILFGFISFQMFFAKALIWSIIAAFAANKAKSHGVSFATAFLLIFFLRFLGLIICIVLMAKNEGMPKQHVASPHSSRASSWDEPYADPRTQQTNDGSHWTEYSTKSYTCPSCANVQEHKGFCMICGAQIK